MILQIFSCNSFVLSKKSVIVKYYSISLSFPLEYLNRKYVNLTRLLLKLTVFDLLFLFDIFKQVERLVFQFLSETHFTLFYRYHYKQTLISKNYKAS